MKLDVLFNKLNDFCYLILLKCALFDEQNFARFVLNNNGRAFFLFK